MWKFAMVLVGCIGVCLLLSHLCREDKKRQDAFQQQLDERWAARQQFYKDFGPNVTILGFQGTTTTTSGKYPTRMHHEYVVVQGANGERQRIHLRGKPALAGEVWSTGFDWERDIYLKELVKTAPKKD